MNPLMEEYSLEEHRKDIDRELDRYPLAGTGIEKQGISPQLVYAYHAETRSMVDRARRKNGETLRSPVK